MFYRGYTDIYVPFPQIAYNKPEKTADKRTKRTYKKEMDAWLMNEVTAEYHFDYRPPQPTKREGKNEREFS